MSSAAGQQQQQQQKRRRKSNHPAHATIPRMMATSNTWELTPLPLFIRIMGYLDNATLIMMCLVCKQIRDRIWSGQGLDKKLIRIFELHPSEGNDDNDDDDDDDDSDASCDNSDDFRLYRFLSDMDRYFNDPTKRRMLQQYGEWKIIAQGVNNCNFNEGFVCYDDDKIETGTRGMLMPGILSLNAASLNRAEVPHCLLHAIFRMVPNLQQLDLSNVDTHSNILQKLSEHCPQIETINLNFSTYRNRNLFFVYADGWMLQSMESLKELYFDNCKFIFYDIFINDNNEDNGDESDNDINDLPVSEYNAMSDLNYYPDIMLLGKLRHLPLERLSIRNLNCDGFTTQVRDRNGDAVSNRLPSAMSQNMLIKFVRNAPSTLVWFRSDLSAANIQMLQSERPGMEFVS